ncbi:AI-2E family transporter [Nonomuraea gerenzanensis]|uniref:AI-2E family transporter n=1 Tax=Nonomuraea gerenzanensis TaxID=93944 RepID=UPI001CD99463|nr:AI-2E family transporter [Nonomuraea gerenzanensis]UBU09534.1 AI-2E family transporter [Nonomuraea gerenzanensis]
MRQTSHSRPSVRSRLEAPGVAGWLFTGLALGVVVLLFVLQVLRPLLLPLLLAAAIAVVIAPLADRLTARRMPRPAAAALCCLAVLVTAALCGVVLVVGLRGQLQSIGAALDVAWARAEQLARDLGMAAEQAGDLRQTFSEALPTLVTQLLSGLAGGVAALVELVVGLALGLYLVFFMLKDTGLMTSATVRFLPVPADVGREAVVRAAGIIRRYFLGMTLIALMNTVLIVGAALILGVPALGVIALATFLGAYIPYAGAFVSGAFTVLIALGSGGVSTALWMLLVVLLANGTLQNLLAPFVFGAALRIHPMVVLLVTVLAGILAGLAGVMLAVPVTALALDLARLIKKHDLRERDDHHRLDDQRHDDQRHGDQRHGDQRQDEPVTPEGRTR